MIDAKARRPPYGSDRAHMLCGTKVELGVVSEIPVGLSLRKLGFQQVRKRRSHRTKKGRANEPALWTAPAHSDQALNSALDYLLHSPAEAPKENRPAKWITEHGMPVSWHSEGWGTLNPAEGCLMRQVIEHYRDTGKMSADVGMSSTTVGTVHAAKAPDALRG